MVASHAKNDLHSWFSLQCISALLELPSFHPSEVSTAAEQPPLLRSLSFGSVAPFLLAPAETKLCSLLRSLSSSSKMKDLLTFHSVSRVVAASHYSLLPLISHFAPLASQHSHLNSLKEVPSIKKPNVLIILLTRLIDTQYIRILVYIRSN